MFGQIITTEWAATVTPLGACGRADPVPEFWLPGGLCDMVKLHEEHVLEVDTERCFALLNPESVKSTVGFVICSPRDSPRRA